MQLLLLYSLYVLFWPLEKYTVPLGSSIYAFMSTVPVGAEIRVQRGYNVHVDALLRTKIEKCNVVSMSSSIGSAYFVLLRFIFKKDRLQLLLCDH